MNLSLLPFREEFLDRCLAWRKQALFVRHNPLKLFDRAALLEHLSQEGTDLSDLEAFKSYKWFIEWQGQIVGNVSLSGINSMMRFAEIGYGMDEAFYGRGLATEAVRQIVRRVFRETILRKLVAFVHEENLASCRVLDKVGFVREGLLREHYIIDGKPVNEAVFGLLRRDFSAERGITSALGSEI